MSMENTGFVTEVSGDTVKVRVIRESACGGNCAGCHGCPSDAVVIECRCNDSSSYGVGDAVKVEMQGSSFFCGILMSYGLMTFWMIFGAVAGYIIWEIEVASVVGGFLGLFLGGVLMKLFSGKKEPQIKISHLEK